MKVIIYQPFTNQLSIAGLSDMIHAINEDAVVELIYDFDELLNSVETGMYGMVFARRPEHYLRSVLKYHQLMHCAIETNTKIYETSSFNELTFSFKLEAMKPFNELQMQVIHSYINKNIR